MQTITIAIIIGIITTIYKKTKDSKNEKTQSRPFSLNRGDFQEAYKKLKEVSQQSPNSVKRESSFSNEPVLVDSENVEQKPFNNLRNGMNQIETDKQKSEKRNDENLSHRFAEQKKLVDAVIWSEILGEPRSKKSYFAKRRY